VQFRNEVSRFLSSAFQIEIFPASVYQFSEIPAEIVPSDVVLICVSAFVSPYRKDRERVKSIVEQSGQFRFFEVFVDAPLDVCEARDPKGLYRQAREGKIPFFTGISDPYEPPEAPALTLDSSKHSPEYHAQRVMDLLSSENLFLDRSSHARCVLGSGS
ncbi:MAG: adenylyl-sulfate kinase, partial [Pirellula sp.]